MLVSKMRLIATYIVSGVPRYFVYMLIIRYYYTGWCIKHKTELYKPIVSIVAIPRLHRVVNSATGALPVGECSVILVGFCGKQCIQGIICYN